MFSVEDTRRKFGCGEKKEEDIEPQGRLMLLSGNKGEVLLGGWGWVAGGATGVEKHKKSFPSLTLALLNICRISLSRNKTEHCFSISVINILSK